MELKLLMLGGICWFAGFGFLIGKGFFRDRVAGIMEIIGIFFGFAGGSIMSVSILLKIFWG